MELCSLLYGSLEGREGSLRENGYMDLYGWVPSLFTWNYAPIQNKEFKKTNKDVNSASELYLDCGQDSWTTYNKDFYKDRKINRDYHIKGSKSDRKTNIIWYWLSAESYFKIGYKWKYK